MVSTKWQLSQKSTDVQVSQWDVVEFGYNLFLNTENPSVKLNRNAINRDFIAINISRKILCILRNVSLIAIRKQLLF